MISVSSYCTLKRYLLCNFKEALWARNRAFEAVLAQLLSRRAIWVGEKKASSRSTSAAFSYHKLRRRNRHSKVVDGLNHLKLFHKPKTMIYTSKLWDRRPVKYQALRSLDGFPSKILCTQGSQTELCNILCAMKLRKEWARSAESDTVWVGWPLYSIEYKWMPWAVE